MYGGCIHQIWIIIMGAGSHCLDLMRSAESDPIWLKIQRKQELRIIKSWVENYYREIK